MDSDLFSISIPTYNRAEYLDRCLKSIINQININALVIINVYDNDSKDNTEKVVKKYQNQYKGLHYLKNQNNIGPDLNIGQCYYTSTSKYTLVFGDDDVFLEGALEYIFKILNSDTEFGLVFLNYYHFKHDFLIENPEQRINSKKKTYIFNNTDIVKIAGFRIGFISSCIVNTKAINKLELIENAGTHFNHLYPILKSCTLGYDNLYIKDFKIAQQIDNFSKLDVFKVFANDYYEVIVQNLGKNDKAVRSIENELIVKILPSWIQEARKNNIVDLSNNLDSIHFISDNYKRRLIFWFFNYPVINWCLTISSFMVLISRIISKIYFPFHSKCILLFKHTIKN
jgi:glycosyltransferase involved in cell wall biosynthesis